MSAREEQMSKLLDYPYDAFLMIRLEYIQILGDELEAKCLRIIEKYSEAARKRLYQQAVNDGQSGVVEIPTDVTVYISHRTFMNDLFGTVTAENTVKRAVKNLEKKHLVFSDTADAKRHGGITYQMNIPFLQGLLQLLPLRYQSLIPSIFDTIIQGRYQRMTPSWYQELISSRVAMVSKIDTHITVIPDNITDNREVDKSDSLRSAFADAQHTRDFGLTDEDCQPETDLEETVKVAAVPKRTIVPLSETPSRYLQASERLSTGTVDTQIPSPESSPQVQAPVSLSGGHATMTGRAHGAPGANVNTIPPHPAKCDTNPALPTVKGARKPKAPKAEQVAPERIEATITCMEETIRELTGDAEFSYTRTKRAMGDIADLLRGRQVAPSRLKAAMAKMYHTPPDKRTGFDWKEHMTIPAICNNYDRFCIAAVSDGSAQRNKYANPETPDGSWPDGKYFDDQTFLQPKQRPGEDIAKYYSRMMIEEADARSAHLYAAQLPTSAPEYAPIQT